MCPKKVTALSSGTLCSHHYQPIIHTRALYIFYIFVLIISHYRIALFPHTHHEYFNRSHWSQLLTPMIPLTTQMKVPPEYKQLYI